MTHPVAGDAAAPTRAPILDRRAMGPVLLFAALALVPLAARLGTESFVLSLMTRVVVLALAAMALDLLVGHARLVSFGHAAFLGIGAYAVAIPAAEGSTDLLVQLPLAVGAAALFALVTGLIALRTSGVYFIMITLAFGQMAYFLATSLSGYGGDDGSTLPGRTTVLGRDLLRGDAAFYWVCLACLVGTYILGRRLVASRFGRVLVGTGENPTRMEAIGFEPFRYQLAAYVLSGAATGLAGFLLANQAGFVSPATMAWQRSGDLIFMVILGGLGSLHGAVLGAVAFLLAEEVLAHFTVHWRIVFGPLLILVVLFARGGLTGLLEGRR